MEHLAGTLKRIEKTERNFNGKWHFRLTLYPPFPGMIDVHVHDHVLALV